MTKKEKAIINTFTTIEQSKRLLGLGVKPETADMTWVVFVDNSTRLMVADDWQIEKMVEGGAQLVPCWSLGALYAVIPTIDGVYPMLQHLASYSGKYNFFWDIRYYLKPCDSPIDACMDMIEWGVKEKWFKF